MFCSTSIITVRRPWVEEACKHCSRASTQLTYKRLPRWPVGCWLLHRWLLRCASFLLLFHSLRPFDCLHCLSWRRCFCRRSKLLHYGGLQILGCKQLHGRAHAVGRPCPLLRCACAHTLFSSSALLVASVICVPACLTDAARVFKRVKFAILAHRKDKKRGLRTVYGGTQKTKLHPRDFRLRGRRGGARPPGLWSSCWSQWRLET